MDAGAQMPPVRLVFMPNAQCPMPPLTHALVRSMTR